MWVIEALIFSKTHMFGMTWDKKLSHLKKESTPRREVPGWCYSFVAIQKIKIQCIWYTSVVRFIKKIMNNQSFYRLFLEIRRSRFVHFFICCSWKLKLQIVVFNFSFIRNTWRIHVKSISSVAHASFFLNEKYQRNDRWKLKWLRVG